MNLNSILGRDNLTRALGAAVRRAPRRSRSLAAACALVMLALPAVTRGADKLCFNSSFSTPTIDGVTAGDPFWNGSNRYVFNNGSPTPHAVVMMRRAGSSHVVIAFEVNNDATFDANDVIVLTFAPATGGASNHRRIHIFPVEAAGNVQTAPGGPPREVRYWTDSGAWNTGGGGSGAAPTWLYDPATNDASPKIKVTASSPALMFKSYIVEMRIPVVANPGDPGINLAGDFGLYFNIIRVNSSGMSATADEQFWPTTAPIIGGDLAPILLEEGTPAPGTWGQGTFTGPCTGVSVVNYADLFTNKIPNNEVKLGQADNVLSARLTNTGEGAASGVRVNFTSARFGIASPANYLPVPAPGNPTAPSGNIAPSGGTTVVSTGNWDLTGSHPEWEPPNNGLCIVAELTSTVGGTLITNDRAYRNMYFGTASEFRHSALLNARGFGPVPRDTGGRQQFDLYVDTRSDVISDPVGATAASQGGVVSQLTRVYHGYRLLTGNLIINRTGYRLTESVNSFGYVIRHTGSRAVKTWRQELTGNGIERMRDGVYRVMLAPDAAVELTTFVESDDDGTVGPTPTPEPVDPSDQSRFSIGLRAGVAIPNGTFGNIFDPGFSFNGDVEYDATSNFSIQAVFGYHRFEEEFFGGHLDSYHLSANGKVYGGSPGASVRPFINFGGGVYHFRPSQTNGGVNIGGGLQFNVTPRFAFEGAYNFHNVFTPGFNARFSTVQGGVRFRF